MGAVRGEAATAAGWSEAAGKPSMEAGSVRFKI